MANKKRKRESPRKQEARRRAEEQARREEISAQSRRTFLRRAGLATAGLAIASVGGKILYDNISEDPWDFLEDGAVDHSQEEIPFIERHYVPVGERTEADPSSQLAQMTMKRQLPAINRGLRSQGKNPEDYNVYLYIQRYAIPETEGRAQHMLSYAQQVTAFMREALPELSPKKFDWTIVQEGDNYQDGFRGKGFITSCFFSVYETEIKKRSTMEFVGESKDPLLVDGGMHISDPIDDTYWYCLVSTGRDALNTVPSETIPLTTNPAARRLVGRLSTLEINKLTEGLEEALSDWVVRQMVDRLAIPRGHELADTIRGNLTSGKTLDRYALVAPTHKLLDKMGPQALLSYFLKDPLAYRAEVLRQ